MRVSTRENAVAAPNTNLLRIRDKPSGQDTNPNTKLISTSVKPDKWFGTWFKSEKYPKKLKNKDCITIACEG